MKTNKRYLTVVLASVLGAAILSGVAAASPGNSKGTPPGQAKKQSNASASVNASASLGAKPSASTNSARNTNAAAASTQTKIYGNGKTAGQIAMHNGAGASTNLYGPGNSQPHKASLCANGKTHLVDVHALKAHGGAASCASGSVGSTSSTGSTSATGSAGVAANGTAGVSAQAHGTNGQKGALTPPSTTRNGGVQGAVAGQAKAARPVTGAANFTG